MTTPARILAAHNHATKTLTQLGTILATQLGVIEAFTGIDLTEGTPHLDIDEHGETLHDETPPGAAKCTCGTIVVIRTEFTTCTTCQRIHTLEETRTDPTSATALARDSATATLKTLTRQYATITNALTRISTELARYTRPNPTQTSQLRKLAEKDNLDDATDWNDWCRIHRRADGTREPVTTQRPGDKLQMCWRCSKLYGALLRELANNRQAAEAVLLELVRTNNLNPSATDVEAAMATANGVRATKVTANSGTPPSTRRLPGSSMRRRKPTGWHTIDDYRLPGDEPDPNPPAG